MRSIALTLVTLTNIACTALSSPPLERESVDTAGAGGTGSSDAGPGNGGSSSGQPGSGSPDGQGGADAGGGDAPALSGLPEPPGEVPRPAGAPANLRVLDWAGFKGAISFTFDDGTQSQIAHYDDLNALGVRFSFYLVGNRGTTRDPVWARVIADGHEVSNHTQSHLDVGGGDLEADTDAGDATLLETWGITSYSLAAPYGASPYADIASTRYLLNRSATDGLIAARGSTSPFSLPCYIPPQDAAPSIFETRVDAARQSGAWQILLVHGFSGMADGAYQPVPLESVIAGVEHAKALGDVWVDSLINVGAYWSAAKLFASLTPAQAGDAMIWTWALPEHFPPGKYLRVVVDGGTLSQAGAPLPWHESGYYEVSLDAGTLTLAP